MKILVVTSPDSTSAKAAEEGPLKSFQSSCAPFFDKTISTHDPYNTRCGSGGGTLAALMLAMPPFPPIDSSNSASACQTSVDATVQPPTVLIVHAGGESSRCPTQMVLGKSWTTLPCRDSSDDNALSIQTPTFCIIRQLQESLLRSIPQGSVVVAASDTLLRLPFDDTSIDWSRLHVHGQDQHQDDAHVVLGVAVPAPLDTAKNHGVYVLATPSKGLHTDPTHRPGMSSVETIQPVHEFLQKPTVDAMNACGAVFPHPVTAEPSAWIDTGIVVFLPKAAAALRGLAQQELSCCSWDGLQDMWDKYKQSSNGEKTPSSVDDFAQAHAMKVDLYTHMMMALKTHSSETPTLEEYLKRHNDLPENILRGIHQRLSPFQLQTLLVPDGQFLHLGTSKELVHFLVQGTRDDHGDKTGVPSPDALRSRLIADDMQLVSEYQSLLIPSPFLNPSTTNYHMCCYNSLIQTTGKLQIGPGCVLEHVHVQHATADICIGDGCLISGWRGDLASKPSTSNIVIPSKTCLQVIPLVEDQKFVIMLFGLEDDIKDWRKIHGVDAGVFLQMTGMDDLWDSHDKQTLWSAKLHPVVNEIDLPGLFSWVQELQETGEVILSLVSLNFYKSHRRLSLEQIRRLSDAQKEWDYRHDLEHIILPLHRNLLNRQHAECRVELNVKTLATLADVCHKAVMNGMFDVSGRALMVGSAMFADHQCQDAVVEDLPIWLEQILDDLLNSPDNRINSCNTLFEECKNYCDHKSGLPTTTASLALERAASIMTELCVRGTHSPTFERTAPAVANNWILATAPVRVDLSGGWSDTPPICFEYGGAVAGLAVTVDGMKPLSSRCRIIPGGRGIYVCTESRDAITGELRCYASSNLTKVSDLDDCRNPHADCALIKCALVYLGLLHDDAAPSNDLQPFLRKFCGLEYQVGLEIVSTSLLPRGSGLGTSSVLAGCVLACLARCVGINLHENDDIRLVSVVLHLEQLLTCGGGWQDQIGGLFGGFKLGTSKAREFPVIAHVQRMPLKSSTIAKLDDRLILVFSGQTRFAKNILQHVLHRWSRRTPEIVNAVKALVQGAHRASQALVDEDLDAVAECLNNYWSLKKTMAGDDSGVEPEVVRCVFAELFERKEIVAGSLCGAGGGGFMVLLASEGRTVDDVKSTFDQEIVRLHKNASGFTWHRCKVSEKGLETRILPLTVDAFDIAWHMS